MIILEENFKCHLEAFASELFKYNIKYGWPVVHTTPLFSTAVNLIHIAHEAYIYIYRPIYDAFCYQTYLRLGERSNRSFISR